MTKIHALRDEDLPKVEGELLQMVASEAQFTVDQIAQHPFAESALPGVRVRVLMTDTLIAEIHRGGHGSEEGFYFVDISTGYLERLLAITGGNIPAILEAYTAPLEEGGSSLQATNDALVRIWMYAVRFTITHELCHLLCGHLGYWQSLGAEPADERFLFVRELDADGTATQLLTGHIVGLDPVRLDLQGVGVKISRPTTITGLKGSQRVIGYRLALIGSWVALSTLQLELTSWRVARTRYPWPGTRFLNLVSILSASYLERRERIERFNDPDEVIALIEASGRFLSQAVWPVFDRIIGLGDENPLKRLLVTSNVETSSFLAKKDLGQLAFGYGETDSPVVAQLVETEECRAALDEGLKPHRLWKELSFA